MSNITTPHDLFFRNVLQNKEVAKEFFRFHLPANIKKYIDLNSIQLQSDSFIESNLKEQLTDLLYTAQLGERQGYLYALVEHQSTPDKLMPFRLLRYTIAIMDRHLKQNNTDVLPVVYTLVVYTGRRPYNYSTDIFDLFGSNKDLAIDTLFKPHQLIDFNKINDNRIKQYIYHGVIVKTMQHIWDPDIIPAMEREIVPLLRSIIESLGKDYVNTILCYVIETAEISDEKKLVKIVTDGLSKEFGEEIMSFANRLRQEGRQEGIHLGEKIVARNLLKENESIEKIAKVTNLSVEEIKKIKKGGHLV